MYILLLLYKAKSSDGTLLVVENDKSHGSVTVRFGAIIFGMGTFAYFLIEFLDFLEHKSDSPCYFLVIGLNEALALIFVFLQTYLIFMYPRLNLLSHSFLNRYISVQNTWMVGCQNLPSTYRTISFSALSLFSATPRLVRPPHTRIINPY